MTEYTPEHIDAESYYVLGRATGRRNLTGEQAIDVTPYSHEFDEFIRQVKAKAWDEGHNSGFCDGQVNYLNAFAPETPNPYRTVKGN